MIAWLDWLIPEEARGSPMDLLRGRLVLAGAGVSAFLGLPLIVWLVLFDTTTSTGEGLTLLVVVCAAVAAPLLMRATGSVKVGGAMVVVGSVAAIPIQSMQVGMDASTTGWLAVFPLAGTLLGGVQGGIVVSIFSGAVAVFVYLTAPEHGASSPEIALGSTVGQIITVAVFVSIYEIGRNRLRVDLTESHGRLKKAMVQAEAANEAKTRFLSNISHELRTPLNGVMGMISLLLDEPMPSRHRQYAELGLHSAKLLEATVNDILDFTAAEKGEIAVHPTEFSPGQLVEELVLDFAQRAHEAGLELVSAPADDLPERVFADAQRLRQVLAQLIGNAIKFTREGGVEVRIEGAERLVIEVQDSGIGLTPEQRAMAFEAFTQADDSSTRDRGGTGIGLALSHTLIEAMGGELSVQSELGRGSTFRIDVPVEVRRAARRSRRPRLASVRVLLVDQAFSRLVLRQKLGHWGLDVAEADSVEQALQRLKDAAFDLLLVDPQFVGVEHISALSTTAGPTCQVVLMGSAAERDLDLRELGADAIIDKPVRWSALYDRVARLITSDTPADRIEVDGALVVDDNPVNRKVLSALLGRLGVTATEVDSGQAAVDACDRSTYRLVFMDLHMPEMDGVAATRAIRSREGGEHQPIIAVSAEDDLPERRRCAEAGMDGFLLKPVKVEELRTALDLWSRPRGDRSSP